MPLLHEAAHHLGHFTVERLHAFPAALDALMDQANVEPPLPALQPRTLFTGEAAQRLPQPRGRAVEALSGRADDVLRASEPTSRGAQGRTAAFHAASHRQIPALTKLHHPGDQLAMLGHGPFGGLGRRGRAGIGDEIDQRPVGFMADGRDNGDRALGAGADDDLLVEAPEVFQAAAAARHDQHVRTSDEAAFAQGVEPANGRRDLRRAGLALDAHRPEQHAGGEALVEAVQHVANHCARG
jgi:hypothetical protein